MVRNPANMKKILIYGDNLISTFLINALAVLNYDVVDITNNDNYDDFFDQKQIEAIIDLSNAVEMADDEQILFHNNEGICDILQLSCDKHIPFIFVYKEPQNLTTDSALTYALENIKKYTHRGAMLANVQIEDIYGPDLITSPKISEYIHAVTNYQNINLDEKVQDYFIIHQRDFIAGLIAIIKEIRLLGRSKNYTLMPESPISDVELGELISSLSASSVNYEYAIDPENELCAIDIETNYPINWYPTTDIPSGIKDLFEAYGVTKLSQQNEKSGLTPEMDVVDIIENEPMVYVDQMDPQEKENNPEIPLDEQASDADIFTQTNVDQISTQIEQGAKYYKPKQEKVLSLAKNTTTTVHKKVKSMTKVQQKVAVAMSILIFAASFVPTINYVNKYNASLTHLNNALESFNKADYVSAYRDASVAFANTKSLTQVPTYIKIYTAINKKDLQSVKNGTDQISFTSELVMNIANIKQKAQNDDGSVLGATTIAESPKLELDRISELTSLIGSNKNTSFLVSEINAPNTQSAIKTANDIYKVRNANLYEILGFTYKQRYLIITTDETKLTRSGGRILNLIEAEIEKGEITKTNLFDPQLIAQQTQLNGMTPKADEQSKQFLNIENLPFEYSNNYSEFKSFSLYITDLIQKLEKKPKYDGVMQVSNNFYTKIFSKSGDEINIDELISALNAKEILLWNSNPQILAGLYQNGWAGNIPKYKNDLIGIYEAALGEAGNSTQIIRLMEHHLSIPAQDPIISKTTKLIYHNQGKETYTVRLGILVPRNTTLTEVLLSDGKTETNITRSADYKSIGLYDEINTILEILPNEQKTLLFKYETQINNLKNSLNLSLYSQPMTTLKNAKIYVKYQNLPQIEIKNTLTDQGHIFMDEALIKDKTIEIPL